MDPENYIPGVCNIGPAEIARRKRAGWIALFATLILWAALFFFEASWPWYLLIFLSASMAVTGFIQAYSHFCAGFGRNGLFNFGPVGKAETVEQEEFRKKDRQKAFRISAYSLIVGAIVALVTFYL